MSQNVMEKVPGIMLGGVGHCKPLITSSQQAAVLQTRPNYPSTTPGFVSEGVLSANKTV